jgi:hypothetical protein
MSDKTREILLSIGLLLFAAGNYYTVLYVCDLDKQVKNLSASINNLYRLNQYYRNKLDTILSTKEHSSDSEEVIELEY